MSHQPRGSVRPVEFGRAVFVDQRHCDPPIDLRVLAARRSRGIGDDAHRVVALANDLSLLGNVVDRLLVEQLWMDLVSENPTLGSTEVWELYNTTADAHPMHVHEVAFEVVNREGLMLNEESEVALPIELDGNATEPEPWESGFKYTVIAYPGQVTRLEATFDSPGQFVWHCHIVEHEDNEMMRPYRIGPEQPGQPG